MIYGDFKYGSGVRYGRTDISNWDITKRHTYGAKQGTTTRATYGEHILYAGTEQVLYKFVKRTNYRQKTF